jgi:hypothetical protein
MVLLTGLLWYLSGRTWLPFQVAGFGSANSRTLDLELGFVGILATFVAAKLMLNCRQLHVEAQTFHLH